MSTQMNVGDRIIIKLKCAKNYTGKVVFYNQDMIEISDIELEKERLNCNLIFYKPEIENVYRMPQNKSCNGKENGIENDEKQIAISKKDFESLRDMTTQYIYIRSFGEDYRKAMENLSKSENIGLAGIGNRDDKDGPFSILVACTFNQIYLFDLQVMKKLKYLKTILESTYVTKIVHDGSGLHYSLSKEYGVTLNKVFDIQIADTILSRQDDSVEISRNLPEILMHRLNFPISMVDCITEELADGKWLSRPLSEFQKRLASTVVVYLHYLKSQLEKLLLKDFYKNITEVYEKPFNVLDL